MSNTDGDNTVLEQNVIDACRAAFTAIDTDRSGFIDCWELKEVLQALGCKPTDEDLFFMVSEVDEKMNGEIDFAMMLQIIQTQKARQSTAGDDSDLLTAYIACGGGEEGDDYGGCVDATKLIKIIKEDFGLTVDIEALIQEVRLPERPTPSSLYSFSSFSSLPLLHMMMQVDEDGSGEIEFGEFAELLS